MCNVVNNTVYTTEYTLKDRVGGIEQSIAHGDASPRQKSVLRAAIDVSHQKC
jgi:hypothetical protein